MSIDFSASESMLAMDPSSFVMPIVFYYIASWDATTSSLAPNFAIYIDWLCLAIES